MIAMLPTPLVAQDDTDLLVVVIGIDDETADALVINPTGQFVVAHMSKLTVVDPSIQHALMNAERWLGS